VGIDQPASSSRKWVLRLIVCLLSGTLPVTHV
jgi:hypothetical protein